jgi:inner membrane protein involved in colicin E2 resistance
MFEPFTFQQTNHAAVPRSTSMIKRIAAIVFIFLCTAVAWAILGTTIFQRTYSSDSSSEGRVASTWGAPQNQLPPTASYEEIVPRKEVSTETGKKIERVIQDKFTNALALESSHLSVDLNLEHRQKGLLWYSTYKVGFDGAYSFRNPSDKDQRITFTLNFPTAQAIDFPENTLSPTEKAETANGWNLNWNYKNLVSGYQIAMTMPEKLQPGPLAGRISFFAPVSLFFFFFLILIITTMRGIELHPMNYFFLAAAFFSFHLLLAYLVDHVSIHLAFGICSAVSIFLVVSYLRLVVGTRFATREAALAQFIYLVVFSYAFFLKGFTGLAITIGSIITLFVVMQVTGKIRWKEKFATVDPVPTPNAAG